MTFIHQRTKGSSGAGGGGGPSLDYTPDGILNVNDLGLADGTAVASWGFINSWSLGAPSYNASEDAVEFASGQGGGDFFNIEDFNAVGRLTLTCLCRVTGAGVILFAGTDTSDVSSRLLLELSSAGEPFVGGRINDTSSFSSGRGNDFTADYIVVQGVCDWANGELRVYLNGYLQATASLSATGTTEATASKTAEIFGANRIDTGDLSFVGFVKHAHVYLDRALTADELKRDTYYQLTLHDDALA